MEPPLPRRALLCFLAGLGAAGAVLAADVEVRLNGEGLRVSAPRLKFLQGKTLDHLRDGGAVTVDLQYSILTDARTSVFRRAVGQFVVSYDLWEEKFAVTRTLPSRRSVTHLASGAAEEWCLENLPVPTGGLAPDREFWLKLDLRIGDKEGSPAITGDPGISLSGLIEIFSRNARAQQPRWQLDSGALRLANLGK